MKKDLFIKVLRHYTESTSEDAQEILALKDSYPYSQLLHALSARLTKDHAFSNQQTALQMAAVYAADRAVLKDVMTLDAMPIAVAPAVPGVSAAPQKHVTPTDAEAPRQEDAPVAGEQHGPSKSMVGSGDVADEVLHDLERLHMLKHNFEMLFVDGAAASFSTPVSTEQAVTPTAPTPQEPPAKKKRVFERVVEPPKDLSKSRRERIIEMARALNELPKSRKERIVEMARALQEKEKAELQKPTTADNDAQVVKHPRKRKDDQSKEDIIDEIVSTKIEIVPENDKQKEQLEIIDQFIKSQPSITSAKEKALPTPEGDLSSIKTGEFGDNVVSETLVHILVKQGKKDKAVEVLKKLIWKFPQKKAYFAAQIEDLRK